MGVEDGGEGDDDKGKGGGGGGYAMAVEGSDGGRGRDVEATIAAVEAGDAVVIARGSYGGGR